MNLEEFIELLRRVGIDDEPLAQKLFWIFDEDGSGDVDHKELAVGLEMVNNTDYLEKIGQFFELCDDDGSGSIDRKEFYSLLKLNLSDYDERKKLQLYINEVFRDFDYDGSGELSKEEMIEACFANWNIRNLIEKNLKSLKNLESQIDRDFAFRFIKRIPFCIDMKINQEIVHCNHNDIEKVGRAFETSEQMYAAI